jgi:hypothetical protein
VPPFPHTRECVTLTKSGHNRCHSVLLWLKNQKRSAQRKSWRKSATLRGNRGRTPHHNSIKLGPTTPDAWRTHLLRTQKTYSAISHKQSVHPNARKKAAWQPWGFLGDQEDTGWGAIKGILVQHLPGLRPAFQIPWLGSRIACVVAFSLWGAAVRRGPLGIRAYTQGGVCRRGR